MQRSTYRVSRAGSLRRMNRVDEEIGPPADTEVLVAVKAIGLNFADVFTILGLYRAAPKRNCVPGIEFSGEVLACGSKTAGVRPGDRVMGSIRFGAFTTHLTIDHRYVLPIPAAWSYEEGAACIVQSLTAYYALKELGNLQAGQTVLIHSAAGGVGTYASRIAKRFGATTIGTVGSAAKAERARKEGCDEVLVRSGSFRRDLEAALHGRALDLVLDAVGGRVQKESFDLLTRPGRMVAYGLSEFGSPLETPNYLRLAWYYLRMPRFSTLDLIESNRSVLGFNLIWLYDRVNKWRQLLEEIQALGLPPAHVGATFPFERLKDAVRLLKSGSTTGKVVVTVP